MEVPDTDAANSSGDAADIAYAYKPSVMGAPFEFRLTLHTLEWRRGASAGRTPYGRIRRIRLGFRPMTMQNYRFLTEIWTADGPKLQIASTSWKSLVEHERFDRDYRVFVTELCRRVDTQKCNRRVLEQLIKSGAMDGLPGAHHRAQLLAALDGALERGASEQRDHGR